MFKCTECGLEFENKPEYCDCGNNEFVLTVPKTEEPIIQEKKEEQPEKTYNEPDPERVNYKEQERTSFVMLFHPAAIAVFLFCIICSFLVLFVWNPVSNTVENNGKAQEKVTLNKEIPSIEKLWKESKISEPPVKAQEKTIKQEEPKVTVVPLKKIPVKTKPVQPKVQTIKKPTVNKPVKQPQQATVNKKNEADIKAQEAAQKAQEAAQKAKEAKLKAEAEAIKAAEKAKEAKLKAETEALKAAENAKKAAIAKQELASYKINLRNEIGKKIDFTKVIGDGDCIVAFEIDSTGKLINRSFAKQSTNITLNNAVYNAVMATPAFNPPPALYNREILKLNIRFMSGNFAITLD